MFRRIGKIMLWVVMIIVPLGLLVLGVPRLVTGLYARARVYAAADVPTQPVAIVFGAGLHRNGTATTVLQDRVTVAARLYFAGKVRKLLLSGDNRFLDYNEPGAMREVAISLGVPAEDIVLDYAGRRTYDTCYRAKAIFGVNQAILVTQSFHLPRALFECNHLGVSAVGVASDLTRYLRLTMLYWDTRELFATTAALWDVYIAHPLPVLGDPEPIFP
jgi:SanA protein